MENCLVTKLKGSVNNDSLPIYGAFKLKVVGNTELYFTDDASIISFDFEIIGDGHFCSNNTYSDDLGKTITAKTVWVATSTSCILVVKDAYKLARSSMSTAVEGDFSFLNYRDCVRIQFRVTQNATGVIDTKFENCTHFNILVNSGNNNKMAFDLGIFSNSTTIQYLTGRNGIAHGSLSSLANCTNLVSITLQSSYVTGSISALSALTSLTNIELYKNDIEGDISALNNILGLTQCVMGQSNIEGSVDALLETWWRAGKRNNCTIGFQISQCTFLGNAITVDYIAKFSNNGIVVRNVADTQTIATYDGSTWTTA
jgi:hypothetical protein